MKILDQLLSKNHFEDSLEFIDLFLEKHIPSRDRARAFLWLVYHYFEDPTSAISKQGETTNPFADEYSRLNPGKIPSLRRITPEQMLRRGENVDPPEERDSGRRMCEQRNSFLHRLTVVNETERANRENPNG